MHRLTIRRDGVVEHWTFGPGGLGCSPDQTCLAELRQACGRAAGDPTLRAVVLQDTPAGGSDPAATPVAAVPSSIPDAAPFSAADISRLLQQLAALPQVVIAAVHGRAAGLGIGLLCCADVCLSGDDAVFDAPPAGADLLRGAMSTVVVRRLGSEQAHAWLMAGAAWDARQALKAGLVHEPVPASSLDAAIRQTLDAYLRAGPRAVARTKTLMQQIQAGSRPAVVHDAAMRHLTSFAVQAVDAAANQRMTSRKGAPPWGERRR